MLKRNIVFFTLLLLLGAFGGIASAAAPYASVIAYNQSSAYHSQGWASPTANALGTLDIINMTPWDISIGMNQPANSPILVGMIDTSVSFYPGYLAGINGKKWSPSAKNNAAFAYHSTHLNLAALQNVWKLDKLLSPNPYSKATYVSNPIQIVFNSQAGTGSNTVALDFIATSSGGFSNGGNPATALSFGDGTNNYGWQTEMTTGTNVTHFLTIQASQGQGASGLVGWKPITQKLATTTSQPGFMKGKATNVPVQVPNYITTSGLAYPNFSSVAGDGGNFDLVVILQTGDYVDCALIFLAVPSTNNGFLQGVRR
ncbi:MAG: hypothetical protein AB9917_07940 [Negativicutes bacterium]